MSRASSIRKAAVLVASLDADTADLLLEQMPPEQAEAVRSLATELNDIDPDEQRAVIDEFFRIGPLVPEQNPPGVDLDDYLSSRVGAPIDEYISDREAPAIHAQMHNREPFSFLDNHEPETLVPLLEGEHPQAIALVLSHLSPEGTTSHVLARLPANLQADVIRRLVDLEETDPNVIREVEQAVEAWLKRRQPLRRRVAGEAAVSAILNSADGRARRQILNNLAVHDRPLAHRFAPPVAPARRFTFKQLCRLPVEALLTVVRCVDRQRVVWALAGAPAELVDELLDQMNETEAQRIVDGLARLGAMRLSDIDRAQDELAELASQMHAEGRLPGVDVTHLTAVV